MSATRSVLVRLALPLLLAISVPACAPSGPPAGVPVTQSTPAPAAAPAWRATTPPAWRPGDRWVFEWNSGKESGSKTVEVSQGNRVKDVDYYVARISDVDHYYTADLRWAFAVRDSKVEARIVPPMPWFVWPLEPGRQWSHRGTFEQTGATTAFASEFRTETIEPVEVPAGRFQAMKVSRRTDRGDSDEYWYAPDVKWYVRWIGRRGNEQFEERLVRFQAAGERTGEPTAPPPAGTPPPSSR